MSELECSPFLLHVKVLLVAPSRVHIFLLRTRLSSLLLSTLSSLFLRNTQGQAIKVRQLAITTVILSIVILFLRGTLTVRQLAMTMTTLSRITAILFQLGINKARQLAIPRVFLSSVIVFRLGTLLRSGNWP